ncbi:MAG: ABC transporter substrate-binding protein [Betaproteobacteria bacterium]|nr:ABC transporter substrate-binding protein [Betaproteobacteria bacterium]MBV9362566.1 ABC transporter substrate-binding protein [Betaproteobacteria bacterium]
MGAVVSETGAHAPAAAEYRKGLLLWAEQAKVDLRLKDDASEAAKTGPAYAELITDGAQVLIGPYGSAATLTGSAEAERARRVMLNAAGPSGQVHKRQPRYVFQTSPPYTAYADGVLAIAGVAKAESVYIVARDDAGSREMGEAALNLARKLGFQHVELEIYSAGTVDFLPQLYKAMGVHADAWIAFGEPRDGGDIVKTLKRQGYEPRVLYVRDSPDPRFRQRIGQDAEFILGSKEYDARFPTAGNEEFVKAFKAKWSATPGPLAAAAYAAGTVLAEGVRRAGSADGAKLRAVLTTMEFDTVLGRYKVDPATGAQIGMKPAVTQTVRGRPQPIWPAELAGDRMLLPFLSWAEREIIK